MGSYASYMDSQYEQLKLAFSELEEANRLNKEVNNELLAACEEMLHFIRADQLTRNPYAIMVDAQAAIAKATQTALRTETSNE